MSVVKYKHLNSIVLTELTQWALIKKRCAPHLSKDVFHLISKYIDTPTTKHCSTCNKKRCYVCERQIDTSRHFNKERHTGCLSHSHPGKTYFGYSDIQITH